MSFVQALNENEIFVFGSNLLGNHAGGAARTAHDKFGAESGVAFGLTGQSFAIPTCSAPGVKLSTKDIFPYIMEFVEYADKNTDKTFLVTPIGTGIAGHSLQEIDYLFQKIGDLPFNIVLLWR